MTDAELHVALRETVAIGRRGGYDNDEIAEKLALVVRNYAVDTNSPFEPCADAPIGVVTNCAAMKCERNGCAVAAAKAAPPVSLDDLTISTRRDCQCPNPNSDCEHPTCPRWPQPGHFATEAAELVDAWETGGKGYGDLEQRIAAALAKAAADVVADAKFLGRFASLADDLDYYATKSQPDGYASGLSEAAWKIRRVIAGADPHEDGESGPVGPVPGMTSPGMNEPEPCRCCGLASADPGDPDGFCIDCGVECVPLTGDEDES